MLQVVVTSNKKRLLYTAIEKIKTSIYGINHHFDKPIQASTNEDSRVQTFRVQNLHKMQWKKIVI